MDMDFYKKKRVLVTGHTGFKGAWLSKILLLAGADVSGYSLMPPTEPNIYDMVRLDQSMRSVIGDIRDFDSLYKVFQEVKPEIVFHLAAQPIVLEGYKKPVETYETNVMGTVHLLECIRQTDSVASVVNITTDKVYQNNEWVWGYRENDALDGYDPYSNSKSCSELVTHSFQRSFFNDSTISVSTARAGNVIGGGDFASDRIIPDCVRAAQNHKDIVVRNPNSIRPYQHVLEPLFAYLIIAQKQYQNKEMAGCYNVGPDEIDCVTTRQLVDLFCEKWGGISWKSDVDENAPHEANFLKLDCSKMKSVFSWNPVWNIEQAIEKTVEWYKGYVEKSDLNLLMEQQINSFMKG